MTQTRPVTQPRPVSAVFVRTALTLAALAAVTPAFAHTGGGTMQGGLLAGFTHPLFGLDHVAAMVAVGMWGAFLGAPAIYVLPVTFPLVMAFGGALGVAGVPIPAVEIGIALSAVVLGLLVAVRARPSLWIASVLVAIFAIFHGHAHGAELPEAANPFTFAAGFVIATGLLHLIGITFGLLVRWPAGQAAVRAGGVAISLAGFAFLFGLA